MDIHGIKDTLPPTHKKNQRQGEGKQTAQRVLHAFRPYTSQIILTVIAILIITALGLLNPLLIRVVIDTALPTKNVSLLLFLVTLMVIAPMVMGVVTVWQTYLSNSVGQRVVGDFRNSLYRHLQKLSLRFFTTTPIGDIQSRLTNDIGSTQSVITDTITRLLTNISTVLSTIIAMLYLSPLLTLITLGLLPFFLLITYRIGTAGRALRNQTQQSLAALSALTQETLSVSGVLVTKSFGRQDFNYEQFTTENKRLVDLGIRQQMIGRWFFMFVNIVFTIAPALVYLVAGLQIINQASPMDITLGGIVAFTTLQSRLFAPIGQLLNAQVEIHSTLALFDRMFEYLDLKVEIEDGPKPLQLLPEKVHGHVAFKNVAFSYTCNDDTETAQSTALVQTVDQEPVTVPPRMTLRNISFEIHPGQLVALVGPSGAGKTTITYLLPRHYDVSDGSIEIDGHNVKNIALSSLGEIIGVVTQETYLFHASIKKNLLYARPDATDEEICEAARAASIHERIMELPDGYDTLVGERGYKFSGGEKQRLAIARVILKNPRFLILDEATSALDTHSERSIQAALEPLVRTRTTLAIAHRLSTVLAADMILVMKSGEIVERGKHAELLQLNGVYTQLYNEQFVADTVDATP